MSDAGGDMVLAFSLAATERLADPTAAFADAQTWSSHIGTISHQPRDVKQFADEHALPQDFFTGNRGKAESLALIRQQFPGGRYVFVGVEENDRRIAESVDWEFRPIEEAAEKAGWELATSDTLLDRVFRVGDWFRD